MSAKQPRFAVGDSVCERFPFASVQRETGTVIQAYEFENEYRYVVRFENGREDVFFERELLPKSDPAVTITDHKFRESCATRTNLLTAWQHAAEIYVKALADLCLSG